MYLASTVVFIAQLENSLFTACLNRYVQHRMEGQWELLSELIIDRGGYVFVAGNAKQMPDQVRSALQLVLAKRLGEEAASLYLKNMEKSNRIQLETWS